jgi:4-hydroxy-tetrahydrodipicolinate reductase
MAIRVVVAGATGWTGSALVQALLRGGEFALAGAVSRSAAGQDAGEAIGLSKAGIVISGSLAEALAVPSDVVVDYTKPNAVKRHALMALEHGRHVVIGTSGLGAPDYREIDEAARSAGRGVIAAGNFSVTAALLKRFAQEAARYVPDFEVIDYASASKPDTPSGTVRELAEALAEIKRKPTARPVAELSGLRVTRGAAIGDATPVQVHSLRLPSYVIACEAVFGAPDERLTIRHDAGSSATPYVAGTLLAIRRVGEQVGLRRGLDTIMG